MPSETYLYAIYDKDIESYISKNMGGFKANKATWVSSGAAKNAALLMPPVRKLLPANSKRFADQTRFEIHKVKLQFVQKI